MDGECTGCDWTSFELVLAFQDQEKLLSFLFAHRLLTRTAVCRHCDSEVPLNLKTLQFRCNKRRKSKKSNGIQKPRCGFKKSALKGTFFEHSHLSIEKIILLTYFFVSPQKSVTNVARELRVSAATVSEWYNLCLNVLGGSPAEVLFKKAYVNQSERFHQFLVRAAQVYGTA